MDHKKKQPKPNLGSAPLPDEAFNSGDMQYDDTKANDEALLKKKMKKKMATKAGKENGNDIARD